MADEYSISAKMTLDVGNFSKSINQCTESLKNFGKNISNSTKKMSTGLKDWGVDFDKFFGKGSKILKDFGLDVDKLASKLGPKGKLILALVGLGVAIGKLGRQMNEAVGEIVKGTGATGEALKGLEQSFKNVLTGGVRSSMQEVGMMVSEINTRFGYTGKELETLTDKFDMFATVTGVNGKEAIDDVADVMKKWGISNEDTGKLLDQLTKASQDSGISVKTLTATLKQGRTVFSQFGMSTTKSIAFLESMSKAGVDVESAMQGMRFALNKFTAEGRNAQTAFAEISDAIKNATSDSEALKISIETFGTKAGAEMINVFRNGAMSVEEFEEALKNAGGVLEETEANTRTSKEALKEFGDSVKSMIGGVGQGLEKLFRDLIDTITDIVRGLTPVVQPVAEVMGEILSTIGSMIRTFVQALAEFRKRFISVWDVLCKTMQTAYQIIHRILVNIQKTFSNLFGFIFALLDKEWALAWEYAKNTFLRFADSILYAMTQLIKLMSPMLNKILEGFNKFVDIWNWIQEKLGNTKAKKFTLIDDSFDLGTSSGLTKALEDSNKKINQLSGKAKKQMIGTLGEVKNVSTEVARGIENTAQSTTDSISKWNDKLRQQQIEQLERDRNNAVTRAKNEKKSEEEIFAIKEQYNEKIRALKEEAIRDEMNAELKNAKNSEESAKIQTYYLNEIAKLYEDVAEKTEASSKKRSQWDSKLLAQNIALLEAEENESAKRAENEGKSEAQIFAMRKQYGEKIIALKKEQIEAQRQADLEGVNDPEEIAKVNLYYQNEITKMTKEENEKRKASNEKTLKDMVKDISKFAKNAIQVFKSIGDTFKKIWSGIKSLAVNVAKGLTSSFKNIKNFMDTLFNLDPTETLTKMLEYEDKVLTFFVSGVQKIPNFVNQALSSISVLMDKLFENIDMEQIGNVIQSVIESFVKYAPKIAVQVAQLFTQIIQTAVKTIIENMDAIVDAFGKIFMAILDNLPTILRLFVTAILSFIKNIGEYINANADQIVQDLVDLVTGIVQALIDFITTGGWKTLLDAIVNIIKAVNKAITDNIPAIVDAIIAMLPDLVDAIIEIIVDINKSSKKIMKPIMKLVVAIIKAIITIITNEEVIESALEAFIALIEAVLTELLPELPKIVWQLVKGLVNAFLHINWGSLVKQIFKAFINGIKKLFGIHSPSTLFEGFGKNMVAGLVKGLKNIWGSVKDIFSGFSNKLKDVFGNIGSGIGNAMSTIFDTVKGWASSIKDKIGEIWDSVKDVASTIGGGIKDFASDLGGKIKSGVKKLKFWATGTPSAPAGLSVVGERGPELVNFKGGEQVINAENTRKMLSGGGNNTSNTFSMVFNNTPKTTAFEMMREVKKYSRQLAFNGVL